MMIFTPTQILVVRKPTGLKDGGLVDFQGQCYVSLNQQIQLPKKNGSTFLGGGFKDFLCSPYLGKISNLTNIFQMG